VSIVSQNAKSKDLTPKRNYPATGGIDLANFFITMKSGKGYKNPTSGLINLLLV